MTMAALRGVYVIWLRELKVFGRERSRIVGMIGQPLLYLLVLGKGLSASMSLNGAPPGVGYLRFMYPGIIGMSVLFTAIFSAVSIIWDREFGFLKEVLVAPVPRWAVAMGKILGGASVATLQSAILVVLAPFIGMSLSPLIVVELLVVSFIISFAVTSLGVAMAARMDSMQGFQMLMNFLVMPLYFLSGAMFPVTSAPAWMRTLMVVDPLTYGVDALRGILFSGTSVNGVNLLDMAHSTGLVQWSISLDAVVMLGVGLLLALIAASAFNRAE